ncbi:SNF2 helicase-associated domain-containing protein, partial [Streptomyces boncukensis]|nr:ATP-dependent helicase [Streptomyces boncukensis]
MARAEPEAADLVRRAAVFLPAAVPREGRVAFWWPDAAPPPAGPAGAGGAPPAGADEHLVVAGLGPVPARVLSVGEALPVLTRARTADGAHPAAACWGAAALHALRMVAMGRLVAAVGEGDVDVWRAGPLGAEDAAQVRGIAAALPFEGHAVPVGGGSPEEPLLPEPEALVRAFLDAVADVLPRTAAAPLAAGEAFAGRRPQRLGERFPAAREWASEVAAELDAGVRISLRVDLAANRLFDSAGDAEERGAVAAALVQVHSVADPTLVADAADLWRGEAEYLGPRARSGAVLAVRRAARVWPPLGRLLDRPAPDVLPLSEEETDALLGRAGQRLAAADVAVHWPRTLARELTAAATVRARGAQAPGSAADSFGFFQEGRLLEFRWQLALDGEPLTESEMAELAETHRPLVRLRDQWVLVDPALVRKARKRDLGLLSPGDALAMALTGTAEVDGEETEIVPEGALARLR